MNIRVEVSLGEFLDKMTILEIKSERIRDAGKLKNIQAELESLQKAWERFAGKKPEADAVVKKLKSQNEILWDIEDRIREKESRQAFDDEFVELARSVYIQNDRRAALKRDLNRILNSSLVEEKSYSKY